MSDLPASTSTFVSEELFESNDELINLSALKKMMKQMMRNEIVVMKQMMRHEVDAIMKHRLQRMVIGIFHSDIVPIIGDSIRPIRSTLLLQEKLEETMQKYLVRDQGENEVETSPRRSSTLRFRNQPSTPIYTGKEIKAKDGTPVVVELVDLDSGQVVESGPEAEAKVQFVLLEGEDRYDDNCTSEVFGSKIVGERKGTKLGGNVIIKLEKGVGVLDNLKFVSSKTSMPQGVFKLGVRMLVTPAGIDVTEGKSESLTVKDFRNENSKKSEIPQLSDDVCKLRKISRNKKIHNNLKEQGVHTVEDFLLQYFKDPEGLKCMAGMKNKKDWEDTVRHARACKLDNNISCYLDLQENKGVVFNLVDQVLGLVSWSDYIPVYKFSDRNKAEAHRLALYALENGKDLLPFDDEASVVSYLSFNPVVPHSPENPQIQNIEPQVDPSFAGGTLFINCGRGSPITIRCDEVGTNIEIDDQPSGSQGSFSVHDPENWIHGLDDYLRENLPNCQFQEHGLEANTEERNSNRISKADKRWVANWVMLVNRLRGSMVKKRFRLEKLPVRKRQKTDSVCTEPQSPTANSFPG